MKTLLLYVCSFLFTSLSAQVIYSENFNLPPGATIPAGWVVSPNSGADNYTRPYECTPDKGLLTPGVGKTAPTRMILPTWTFDATRPVIYIRFTVYVFDANLNCLSVKDFPCSTYVTALLIRDTYSGGINELPQPAHIYAAQSYELEKANGSNTLIFNAPPIEPGASYRLYLDFKTAEAQGCVSSGTKFVFDDFTISKDACDGPCIPVANADYFEAGRSMFTNTLKANVYGGFALWADAAPEGYDTRSLDVPPAVYGGEDYDANNHPLADMDFILVKDAEVVSSQYCLPGETPEVDFTWNGDGTFECTRSSICVQRVEFQYKIIDPTGKESPVTTVTIDFPPNSALPVVFGAFTAVRNGEVVALKWQTATEQQNHGFYVQRNTGGGWKDIAFVFSQSEGGNSISPLSYAYNDRNAFTGLSQYRILQVDLDGRGRYSDVRAVRGEAITSKVVIYPNPSSTGSVEVLVNDGSTESPVELLDVQGRVLRQWNRVSGVLHIDGLREGLYLLRLRQAGAGTLTTEKIVITH